MRKILACDAVFGGGSEKECPSSKNARRAGRRAIRRLIFGRRAAHARLFSPAMTDKMRAAADKADRCFTAMDGDASRAGRFMSMRARNVGGFMFEVRPKMQRI